MKYPPTIPVIGLVLIGTLLVFGCQQPLETDVFRAVQELVNSADGEAVIDGPSAPTPSTGSVLDDATPLLDWEDVAGASAYHLQVSAGADFSGALAVDQSAIAVSQFEVHAPLPNGTTYSWRVRVQNVEGVWGPWSKTWTFSVSIDLSKPALPDPSDGVTIRDTSPLLDWSDVSGAAGYELQVAQSDLFDGVLTIDESGLLGSQYQIETALLGAGTYYWRVRSHDADGVAGSWGGPWSFTVSIDPPDTPGSPLDGATVSDSTPTLDWPDVSGINSYRVRLTDGASTSIDTTVTESRYTFSSALSTGGPFSWEVASINEDGVQGPWSTPAWSFSVRSLQIATPAATEIWRIGSQHTITWDSIGVTSVRIEIYRDGAWSYIDGGSAIANTGSFTWTVTGPVAEDARIRVSDAADAATNDEPASPIDVLERVWYVDASASGGDGTSWASAYTHLQDAVNSAIAGDEVWVKTGNHTRYSTLQPIVAMKNGVSIYGGFAGSEARREQRDWATYGTTLDGGTSDATVVVGASSAALDGFTITGNGPSNSDAGLYVDSRTGFEVANTNFTGLRSYDGAAAYFRLSTAIVRNCTFSSNTSYQQGGAFWSNQSSVSVHDSVFRYNEARGDDLCEGGAIAATGSGDLLIENSNFEFNIADGDANVGKGSFGGAVFIENVSAVVRNSRFAENEAQSDGHGGAIYVDMAQNESVTIENSTFMWNHSYLHGGAFAVEDGDYGYSPVTIVNSSFSENWVTSGYGGSVYNYQASELTIVNSILDGSSAGGSASEIHNADTSVAAVTYSHVDGGYSGTGNINGSIAFQNPRSDLRLRSTSDGIDGANTSVAPATDKDGHPRNGAADMGAYEYWP